MANSSDEKRPRLGSREDKESFLREMIIIDEIARAEGTVVTVPLSDEEKGPQITEGNDD